MIIQRIYNHKMFVFNVINNALHVVEINIIAYHAKEGDLAKRSVEAIIVHHADFVSFEPFKE